MPTAAPCKGQIYRLSDTQWMEPGGSHCYKRTMIPQKHLSCPGCPRCEGVRLALPKAQAEGYMPRVMPGRANYEYFILYGLKACPGRVAFMSIPDPRPHVDKPEAEG